MSTATKKDTKSDESTMKSGFAKPKAERNEVAPVAPPAVKDETLASKVKELVGEVEAANLHDGVKRNALHRLNQAAAELASEGV